MPTNKDFLEKGYTKCKSTLSTDLIQLIIHYAFFDEIQEPTRIKFHQDLQVPKSYNKYADPAMESVLLLLKDQMEHETGLQLYPTYSFYRIYRAGQQLEKHIDRESCEISASLCFGFSDDIWDLYIVNESVKLLPGDMVIYRGCDLPHWREPLIGNDNTWHLQGFFHYVDQNGPYKDYKFDKRPNLGHLPITRQKTIDNINSSILYF